MRIFRRKTLFHVDEALPDPEELKWRFRRRILLFTSMGALLLLAVPVFRDLRPYLVAGMGVRHFAVLAMETRALAFESRTPYKLEFHSGHWWRYPTNADCSQALPSAPEKIALSVDLQWVLRAQAAQSSQVQTVKSLCFHPRQGLMADGYALEQGSLLISGIPALEKAQEALAPKLLFGAYGSEMHFLTD